MPNGIHVGRYRDTGAEEAEQEDMYGEDKRESDVREEEGEVRLVEADIGGEKMSDFRLCCRRDHDCGEDRERQHGRREE